MVGIPYTMIQGGQFGYEFTRASSAATDSVNFLNSLYGCFKFIFDWSSRALTDTS